VEEKEMEEGKASTKLFRTLVIQITKATPYFKVVEISTTWLFFQFINLVKIGYKDILVDIKVQLNWIRTKVPNIKA
jgi:hypothetical protein